MNTPQLAARWQAAAVSPYLHSWLNSHQLDDGRTHHKTYHSRCLWNFAGAIDSFSVHS